MLYLDQRLGQVGQGPSGPLMPRMDARTLFHILTHLVLLRPLHVIRRTLHVVFDAMYRELPAERTQVWLQNGSPPCCNQLLYIHPRLMPLEVLNSSTLWRIMDVYPER